MNKGRALKKVSTKGLKQKYQELTGYSQAHQYLWRVHLQGCLRAGRSNELTVNEFMRLSGGDCHYCGAKPFNFTKLSNIANTAYNGIDRIDNTRGYSISNSVSCCKLCNSMKGNRDLAEFLNHIQKIAAHPVTNIARA